MASEGEEKSSKKKNNSCLRLLGCSFRGCRFWPGVPQSFDQSASGHTMQHTLLTFHFLEVLVPKSHLQRSLHPLPETFDMTTTGSANFKTLKVKPSNCVLICLIYLYIQIYIYVMHSMHSIDISVSSLWESYERNPGWMSETAKLAFFAARRLALLDLSEAASGLDMKLLTLVVRSLTFRAWILCYIPAKLRLPAAQPASLEEIQKGKQ